MLLGNLIHELVEGRRVVAVDAVGQLVRHGPRGILVGQDGAVVGRLAQPDADPARAPPSVALVVPPNVVGHGPSPPASAPAAAPPPGVAAAAHLRQRRDGVSSGLGDGEEFATEPFQNFPGPIGVG